MRKDEIVVGGTYSNGKLGRREGVRRVIGEGPEFAIGLGQEDRDCVKYDVISGPKIGGCCTRASFAAWAKKRVEDSATEAA